MRTVICLLLLALYSSCKNESRHHDLEPVETSENSDNESVKVIGAMRDVMWKGELGSKIKIDTIQPHKGLYGIGPLAFLKGEILILNGNSYVSRITDDGEPIVAIEKDVTAPFFVYGNQNKWKETDLPDDVNDLDSLEEFIDKEMTVTNFPFIFKLSGNINHGSYHIQNLADNSMVSNPTEAHAGQRSFIIKNQEVTIVGFYSRNHKGIFTHHDTHMHLHMITADKSQMGHLDEVDFHAKRMQLYLPE